MAVSSTNTLTDPAPQVQEDLQRYSVVREPAAFHQRLPVHDAGYIETSRGKTHNFHFAAARLLPTNTSRTSIRGISTSLIRTRARDKRLLADKRVSSSTEQRKIRRLSFPANGRGDFPVNRRDILEGNGAHNAPAANYAPHKLVLTNGTGDAIPVSLHFDQSNQT